MVDTARFRQALDRYRDEFASHDASCGAWRYRILRTLYEAPGSRVLLARRCGRLAENVVLKYADAEKLERESEILHRLQTDTSNGSAYFSRRLPECVALGDDGGTGKVMVLRHPPGFWASLAEIRHSAGLDPRHAVWMWRRVLEVLAHVHSIGWRHGRVTPEHMLVHPADHGILLIGWSGASRSKDTAQDLMQSAWSIRALLAGNGSSDISPEIPRALPLLLADVLHRACTDTAWLAAEGAAGIHRVLGAAAAAAYGKPQFLPFQPLPSR